MTTEIATNLPIPGLLDVLAARNRIRPYLSPTPMHHYPALSELVGTEVWVKHENYQPVGAFKVRGGVNLLARLDDDTKARGVIGASTGNHGQSIAFAARLFGVKAYIVAPEGANPGKVSAMQGLGAEVLLHGNNFDEARLHCEMLAEENGYRYIHSGNEPDLIAGVGTEVLEMLEAAPDLDTIIVPVGGGSGAAGACIAAHGINPAVQVIGVQSEAAPAAYLTWKEGKVVERPSQTFAEGLATGVPFALPQSIMARHLADFILVSDDEIRQAVVWMVEKAHTLTEAAGASPLAAAIRLANRIEGRKVGLVCSGGNTSPAQLKEALDRFGG